MCALVCALSVSNKLFVIQSSVVANACIIMLFRYQHLCTAHLSFRQFYYIENVVYRLKRCSDVARAFYKLFKTPDTVLVGLLSRYDGASDWKLHNGFWQFHCKHPKFGLKGTNFSCGFWRRSKTHKNHKCNGCIEYHKNSGLFKLWRAEDFQYYGRICSFNYLSTNQWINDSVNILLWTSFAAIQETTFYLMLLLSIN